MRLLNTSTFQFHEFYGPVPKYAILSHTWKDEEVTLQEILYCDSSIERKAGYKKIVQFCQIAMDMGFEYGWIDTCCIDKTNSTELSEAINSMFNWYRDADVCIAYLHDISTASGNRTKTFGRSRWFTRGWTLQELLAPTNIDFYGSTWHLIATKCDSLQYLSEVTGIDQRALSETNFRNFSVAARMSWAAKRNTTRIEDIAYCLMGIFDVNMPLLYGEGGKAFTRLQEEIARGTDDQSLFAWDAGHSIFADSRTSVFSPSPAFFNSRVERTIESYNRNNFSYRRMPYTVTNMGLRITLPIVKSSSMWDSRETFAVLDCHIDGEPVCIQLEKLVRYGSRTHYYCRRTSHTLATLGTLEGNRCAVEEVYILAEHFQREEHLVDRLQNPDTGYWSTQECEINALWRTLKDKVFALDTIGGPRGSHKAWLVSDIVAFAYMARFGLWPVNRFYHLIMASCLQGSKEDPIGNMWPIAFILFIFILDRQCLFILLWVFIHVLNFHRACSYFICRQLVGRLLLLDDRVKSITDQISTFEAQWLHLSDRVRNYTIRKERRSWDRASETLQLVWVLLKPFLLFKAFKMILAILENVSAAWGEFYNLL